MGFLLDPHGSNPSPFEAAIIAESPTFHARFRDGDFSSIIADSSGNGRDLVKQIATATRSAVATRTTHPGGAYFPSVTFTNWATLGTFYKAAADNVLNGATEFTMLISIRQVVRSSAVADHRFMGITTEDVGSSTAQLVAEFSDNNPNEDTFRVKVNTGGLIPLDSDATGTVADGVNHLFTARSNGAYTLRSSRPGNTYLLEETTLQQNLAALNRPILVNSRPGTGTGGSLTPGFVIDQIAIWETDIGSTAETNLHTLWNAELGGYYPSMMLFDGSTGFYNATFTASGNLVTGIVRFNRASFTGGGVEDLLVYNGGAGNRTRLLVRLFASDHANTERADKVVVATNNSSGTGICRLISPSGYLDGEDHVVFYAFDGDNGTAVFRIDEVDADDTGNVARIAPTTGTLDGGASSTLHVGATSASSGFFSNTAGFVGIADAYRTNYADFMDGNLPKAIDEKDWTEFGGTQPEVFSHTGKLDGLGNKGSIGAFTKNGTITMTEGGSP